MLKKFVVPISILILFRAWVTNFGYVVLGPSNGLKNLNDPVAQVSSASWVIAITSSLSD